MGLIGASDDVVKRVQDAWLDRLQAIAALNTSTSAKRISKRVSRLSKVQLSGITSDGYVIGWGQQSSVFRYFYFKYPNWIEN